MRWSLLLLVLLALWLAPVAAAPERIDEVEWTRQVFSKQPALFDQPENAARVLMLKPQYRASYLGFPNLDDFLKQYYSVGQQSADAKWSVEQREMSARMRSSLPKNVQVAGYDPQYFVGYLDNGFHGIRETIGYKVFFELKDATSELTPQVYLEFAEFLGNKGFVGDSKIPLTPGQARFNYNNVIVHAASLEHALYAEKLGVQFFGEKLSHTARGIDSYMGAEPADWHHFLAGRKGSLDGLPPATVQYLTYASAGASAKSAAMDTRTGSSQANLTIQQQADLAEAQRQADEIMNNAKREAANYDAQADRIVQDMKGVPAVGRGSYGRSAYNDASIEAATHDLREHSKYALERGQREAGELLRRARVRAGLPESQ